MRLHNASHSHLRLRHILTAVAAVAAGLIPAAATGQATGQASAPTTAPLVSNGSDQGKLSLKVNQSRVVQTARPYARVAVAAPDVADVNALGPTTVLITAKRPGKTQVVLFDDNEQSEVLDVDVSFDLETVQAQLNQSFAAGTILVGAANEHLVLRGQANDLYAAQRAQSLVEPFGKVINMIEVGGGQQVLLKVQFAEVSRAATTSLGVNFGIDDGISVFGSNIGQISPLGFATEGGLGITNPSSSVQFFGSGEIGSTVFTGFIQALRQNNLLRTLAEPNLIAISGEEASFLAGGEFPVPVAQEGSTGSSTVTVEFKEFGVRLNFLPVVLGDGRIRLKVNPEVSDIDFTNAVRASGFLIPGTRTRRLTTTVELGEGQTFAVGGLLQHSVVASRDAVPLLGDLPILGMLFRSTRYQRNETELVVLVTPMLVGAMNPGEVPPVPGANWRHPNEGQLLLEGSMGGPVTNDETVKVIPPGTPTEVTSNQPAPQFIGDRGFGPHSETAGPASVATTASVADTRN